MYVVYVLKLATIYLPLSDEGKMSNVNALKWQIPSSFGRREKMFNVYALKMQYTFLYLAEGKMFILYVLKVATYVQLSVITEKQISL